MTVTHRPLSGLIAASALMALSATTAHATYMCAVQSSPDGYVALRATANATGALVAKAKPGEAVVIQQHANGAQITRGQWMKVYHFPGDVAPAPNEPDFKKGKVGWMHRRYVGDCG